MAIEKVEDLKKVTEGELTSMEVLQMLLATQNELYKGCEAVIDILVQAALSISVESIVESWISVIEHHSSKSRPLSNDALDAEMMIALNGPSIVHCSGIVKVSMSAYWKQFQNANLHGGHFCRRGTGAIKLYKVSKAVDELNSEPVKYKFML